MENMEEL